MYDRDLPGGIQVVDEWDGGVGWLAHPDEDGERVSHAVVGNDGIWVFDPLDAPGVDDLLANVGNVVGIAVCSNHHSRDAAVFAERYDLPVHVPTWLESAQKKVDAPIVEFDGTLGKSGFVFERIDPIPMWTEAIGYRESDKTLYVPDILLTVRSATVGDERLAVNLFLRPFPLQSSFENVTPEQIIVGHGKGIFEGVKRLFLRHSDSPTPISPGDRRTRSGLRSSGTPGIGRNCPRLTWRQKSVMSGLTC